jgi:hypothetical protein
MRTTNPYPGSRIPYDQHQLPRRDQLGVCTQMLSGILSKCVKTGELIEFFLIFLTSLARTHQVFKICTPGSLMVHYFENALYVHQPIQRRSYPIPDWYSVYITNQNYNDCLDVYQIGLNPAREEITAWSN